MIAISTGLMSHSLALVAFGLDSCVEVLASVVVLWHLGGSAEDDDPGRALRAMRLIAGGFGLLGVYLAVDSVRGFLVPTASKLSDVGTAFIPDLRSWRDCLGPVLYL